MPHHFISYSTVEAQEFVYQLHDKLEGEFPIFSAWLDKRDLIDGYSWAQQLDEAIRDCETLLFVMTEESVQPNSGCALEWRRALRYKKPILPLLLQRSAVLPFELEGRQYIDFSHGFETGIARLRDQLNWQVSPSGELQRLKDQLADAERDLRRAKDATETARIKDEMDDLKKRIADQQKIVDNPESAAQRTQQSIERGLERERQPEKPISGKHKSKFINPPPGIAPDYFQDRHVETKLVADFLRHENQRLMTIVGRGGVGKTAMVCRLLKALEGGRLPDEGDKPIHPHPNPSPLHGEGLNTSLTPPLYAVERGSGGEDYHLDGIVYLSETGTRRANVANLFSDLGKLLTKETAAELDGVYKNPQATTESKVRRLLEFFPEGRFVLLFDNFEDALDENRKVKDTELDEALKTILNAPHHTIKAVITTRVAPRDLLLVQPQRQETLYLDEGLESPFGENILREMDSDGKLGLKHALDDKLKFARERTRGFPRALEALVAILRADRYTTLDDLLANPLPENVTDALVGQAFNRLDATAEKVMQALAAYGRPVPEVAVDYMLQAHLPGINSASVLSRLVNMHFARRETGRFYLHPVDRQYALSLVPKGEDSDRFEMGTPPFTQISLFHQGANYFASTYKPREEWKKLEDLRPQLDGFDLRCEAGGWDKAAGTLLEIDLDYLLLWGHFRLMAGLHERLQGKISDPALQSSSAGRLGHAYRNMGQIDQAINCYEKALTIDREQKNRQSEGTWLGSLGNTYSDLGQVEKAIGYYEQALAIAHEIGDKRSEGVDLGGLGSAYKYLGQVEKAIDYQKKSLAICREIGDRNGEGSSLSILGSYYDNLGETVRAVQHFEQALAIARETGYRYGEGFRLRNLADVLIQQVSTVQAIQYAVESIKIGEEIKRPHLSSYANGTLALAYLYSGDLSAAYGAAEAATTYDVPENNHNVFALLGVIALQQGNMSAARTAFAEAMEKADAILSQTAQYYDALEAKGIALCGLAVCAEASSVGATRRVAPTTESYIEDAKAAFQAAREITKAKGIVGRVLRLFDALADTAGVLAGVRPIAAGEDG